MQPIAYDTTQLTSPQNGSNPQPGDPCHPLCKNAHVPLVTVYQDMRDLGFRESEEVAPTLLTMEGGGRSADLFLHSNVLIRRLTPLECCRLQGFPDGYTQITYKKKKRKVKTKEDYFVNSSASDSAQYAVLGNSMTTNVMRWLGERIDLVDDILLEIQLL